MNPTRALAVLLIGAGACVAVLGRPAAADPGDPETGRAVFMDKRASLGAGARRGAPAAG